jgi:predicted nucleic acid-binding protein
MACMLDADHCIFLIKKVPDITPRVALQDCFMSAIVLGELEYGVAHSHADRRERNQEALLDFLVAVHVLPVTEAVSEAYGQVRAALQQVGTPIAQTIRGLLPMRWHWSYHW